MKKILILFSIFLLVIAFVDYYLTISNHGHIAHVYEYYTVDVLNKKQGEFFSKSWLAVERSKIRVTAYIVASILSMGGAFYLSLKQKTEKRDQN
ncbi:hypothetical protein BSNK01_11730 [Bacillaceae bacterium]